jgi:superfamily II DNA or RNA helicase
MHHFKLRDYQQEIANKALNILQAKKIVYLNMEVRTGKTCTSLEVAKNYGAKKVLFLTKKKAIGSIQSDYKSFGHSFEIQIINNESLHKVTDKDFDLLISDEHHRNGAYPKMNIATKFIKERFSHLPMIFLSGTICPESY